MSNLTIKLATPADEVDLRRLLRENPMPGTISVTFEREPDYFIGAWVEGPFQQTILGRNLVKNEDRGDLLGLAEDHPFFELARGAYRRVDYKNQLYLVAWAEDLDLLSQISQIDAGPPAVEVAIL